MDATDAFGEGEESECVNGLPKTEHSLRGRMGRRELESGEGFFDWGTRRALRARRRQRRVPPLRMTRQEPQNISSVAKAALILLTMCRS